MVAEELALLSRRVLIYVLVLGDSSKIDFWTLGWIIIKIKLSCEDYFPRTLNFWWREGSPLSRFTCSSQC